MRCVLRADACRGCCEFGFKRRIDRGLRLRRLLEVLSVLVQLGGGEGGAGHRVVPAVEWVLRRWWEQELRCGLPLVVREIYVLVGRGGLSVGQALQRRGGARGGKHVVVGRSVPAGETVSAKRVHAVERVRGGDAEVVHVVRVLIRRNKVGVGR